MLRRREVLRGVSGRVMANAVVNPQLVQVRLHVHHRPPWIRAKPSTYDKPAEERKEKLQISAPETGDLTFRQVRDAQDHGSISTCARSSADCNAFTYCAS